ncbi:MAG: hypothetical protein U0L66_03525 [Acutalibacteraceae bacterium]|nr:hypothetical protein [Acutalibacteraceae bacterium]
MSDSASNYQEKEKCILCGRNTEVPVSSPIAGRKYFLQGCGQLCEACYNELEREKASECKMNDNEMEALLEMTRKGGLAFKIAAR